MIIAIEVTAKYSFSLEDAKLWRILIKFNRLDHYNYSLLIILFIHRKSFFYFQLNIWGLFEISYLRFSLIRRQLFYFTWDSDIRWNLLSDMIFWWWSSGWCFIAKGLTCWNWYIHRWKASRKVRWIYYLSCRSIL